MAQTFHISYYELTGEEYDDEDYYIIPAMVDEKGTQYLREYAKLNGVKRGDIIRLRDMGGVNPFTGIWNYDRNDGVMFWDGEKAIPMDVDIDDYGAVPKEFTIGDKFEPQHWMNEMTHNAIVWLDVPRHREQLIQNANVFGTWFDGELGRYEVRFSTSDFGKMYHHAIDLFKTAEGPIHLHYDYMQPGSTISYLVHSFRERYYRQGYAYSYDINDHPDESTPQSDTIDSLANLSFKNIRTPDDFTIIASRDGQDYRLITDEYNEECYYLWSISPISTTK